MGPPKSYRRAPNHCPCTLAGTVQGLCSVAPIRCDRTRSAPLACSSRFGGAPARLPRLGIPPRPQPPDRCTVVPAEH